ncbi:hypothetical protein DFJ69_3847 [Thermomonospora umbrina]|uniref:Aminoglycoside phosphotransferase domain-containing protein n=1 Tax=Thermomonospora umbrina TaxID=111806 RepID=A0A3D9SV36_9ACTN|nr:hypothetical protein DFJ69_3847 [Thermomonospora umbrina]
MQLAHAAELLGVAAPADADQVLGVRGRTLSGPVGDSYWLRVIAVAEGQDRGPLWMGPLLAPSVVGLRRPGLHSVCSWGRDGQVVRGELWERVREPVCSPHEALTVAPSLGEGWWDGLEASLTALAGHSTERVPRTQEQITAAMRRAYGPGVPTQVERWVTQHGDLRWTNVTNGEDGGPFLLDWEFWGAAPAGTDAATLYCTSLLVPEVAAQVYERWREVLESPDGRLAQLCVCLQLRRHRDVGALEGPLRVLARRLVGE